MFEGDLKARQHRHEFSARTRAVLLFLALQPLLLAEKKAGHGFNQRVGQNIRGDHREDHGLGERPEQIARDAAQQQHRREHDYDAEQRHCRRRDDLLGGFHNRVVDLLAGLEMAVDVFNRHGGVVDQYADGERQAAQGHHIDGFANRRQRRQRGQNRQRNRNGDDDRRPPTAQEQQDHQAGQRRGDEPFTNDARHRVRDEGRLIADDGQFDALRQHQAKLGQHFFDARDHLQRGGGSRRLNRHQHR